MNILKRKGGEEVILSYILWFPVEYECEFKI